MEVLARSLATIRSTPSALRRAISDERGASATEYAIIVAIVVAALVGIGALFGQTLANLWNGMIEQIAGFTS
jgi:Flp pilus assembly pilin Flp